MRRNDRPILNSGYGFMVLVVLAFFGFAFFMAHIYETERVRAYQCNIDTSFYHDRYLRGPKEGVETCELRSRGLEMFKYDNCAFKKAWCDNQREISGINAAVKSMKKVQEDLDRAAQAAKQRNAQKVKQELETAAQSTKESVRLTFPLMVDFMSRKVTEAIRWILSLN